MPTATSDDLQRMRDALFFEGPMQNRRLSRFWALLILAAIIATAGVVADSTATVIGAMIVAPLMTPILGIVLAIAVGDRRNLVWSVALVVLGAVTVVVLAWMLGRLSPIDVLAPTNSQVAGRINPRVVDLVAALATGAVGAFALVRSDVGDTLPGVAIAISLVPPLAVVGLTWEAGATDQARGALLLFLTNVAAILFTGTIVMAMYRVRRSALSRLASGAHTTVRARYPVVAIVALIVIVTVPLVASGRRFRTSTLTTHNVSLVASDWAHGAGWEIMAVEYRNGAVVVRAAGPRPVPEPQDLRRMLDERGQGGTDVRLELVPERRYELPGS